MSVQELIDALEKAINNKTYTRVYAYDADAKAYASVTGFTFDKGSQFVTLMTDEVS